jgi:hypothetical protein
METSRSEHPEQPFPHILQPEQPHVHPPTVFVYEKEGERTTITTTRTTVRKFLFAAMVITSLTVLRAAPEAMPITGQLNFVGGLILTADRIDWTPPNLGGFGTGFVLPSTGYFALLFGSPDPERRHLLRPRPTVTELDLNAATQPAGPPGTFPALAGFVTFPGTPLPFLNFTLTAIATCQINCIAGPSSPFNFVETTIGGITSTSIVFNMQGTVTDSNNPGEVSDWIGQWSAVFPGQTGPDILNQLQGPGDFVFAPYSAAILAVGSP